MQLLYLVSTEYTTPPIAWFDFEKSEIMDMYAANQSFYGSAHPEFSMNPENFLSATTGDPYTDIEWYESNSAGTHSQVVGMNCERYSSILEYYNNDEHLRTRKLSSFDPTRLQVLVDSQCVGACALFARTVSLRKLGTVVGVGVDGAGTAPSGISADLDGLECQRRAMKIEDSVPESMLIDHMPYKGQNLVIPLTRLYTPSEGDFSRRGFKWGSTMPVTVAPSVTIPAGTFRPDFKEGAWYSGMQLYCASIKLFAESTSKYKPGCPHCTEEECGGGFSVGWAFLFVFVGVLLLPCVGGVAYFIMQHGCSKECLSAGVSESSMMCYRCFSKVKELCHRCCGSRWERSYGSLSGDPSDGMPAQGCCQGFDWRSYVPGMKASALQDQYSDLQTGGETSSLPTSDPSSSMNEYAPAMTHDSRRVEVTPLSPRAVEVTENEMEDKITHL